MAEVDSFSSMENITMHAAIYQEGQIEPVNEISKSKQNIYIDMSRYAKISNGASLMVM